jgi:hypothetical protein
VRICLCYPTPYKDGRQDFSLDFARQIDAVVQPNGWRVNVDRRGDTDAILRLSGALIPLIDLEDRREDISDVAGYVATLRERLQGRDVPFVEVGNEPYTLARTSGDVFAYEAMAVIEALDGRFTVALACDALRPGGREDTDWVQAWSRVRQIVPYSRYDYAAIHPYHPGAPWLSEQGSREAEQILWKKLAWQKPLVVTAATDQLTAERLHWELAFQARQQTAVVCIYHYGQMLDRQGDITPVGDVVRQWAARQREDHMPSTTSINNTHQAVKALAASALGPVYQEILQIYAAAGKPVPGPDTVAHQLWRVGCWRLAQQNPPSSAIANLGVLEQELSGQ